VSPFNGAGPSQQPPSTSPFIKRNASPDDEKPALPEVDDKPNVTRLDEAIDSSIDEIRRLEAELGRLNQVKREADEDEEARMAKRVKVETEERERDVGEKEEVRYRVEEKEVKGKKVEVLVLEDE
jgi:hypothetical protein